MKMSSVIKPVFRTLSPGKARPRRRVSCRFQLGPPSLFWAALGLLLPLLQLPARDPATLPGDPAAPQEQTREQTREQARTAPPETAREAETPAPPAPTERQMRLEAVEDGAGGALLNYQVDNVEVSQAELEAVRDAALLIDDAGVLPAEMREKISALLLNAQESLDLSYYVHIVDEELYEQLYPQRAYALARGELAASYGGVLVLSEQGGFLLHTSSSLLTTMLGADYVKNANTTATRQAALVAVGAEQRVWTHVSSLIETLAVALEGSKPQSSSSAAYLFGAGEEAPPPAADGDDAAQAAPGSGSAIHGFLWGIGAALLLFGAGFLVLRKKPKRGRSSRRMAEGGMVEGSQELGSLPASKNNPPPKNLSAAGEEPQLQESRQKLAELLAEHRQKALAATAERADEQSSPGDAQSLEEVFTQTRALLQLTTPASRIGLRHGLEKLEQDWHSRQN